MIRLKAGVKPANLVILAAVANVSVLMNLPFDVWITSGNDSKHMDGSDHYKNAALDVRSKNFPNRAMKERFLDMVLSRLGPSYRGMLEAEGTDNEHFHIEVK